MAVDRLISQRDDFTFLRRLATYALQRAGLPDPPAGDIVDLMFDLLAKLIKQANLAAETARYGETSSAELLVTEYKQEVEQLVQKYHTGCIGCGIAIPKDYAEQPLETYGHDGKFPAVEFLVHWILAQFSVSEEAAEFICKLVCQLVEFTIDAFDRDDPAPQPGLSAPA